MTAGALVSVGYKKRPHRRSGVNYKWMRRKSTQLGSPFEEQSDEFTLQDEI